MREIKYWIIVASKDHVKTGKTEGIAQACHGKSSPLRRMQAGDMIIYYSGKRYFYQQDKCHEFTAIGKVTEADIYKFQMTPEFCPYRRNLHYLDSEDVSILPLINHLDFIKNKEKWGFPFRWGFFEINNHDFSLISSKMLNKEHVEIC